MLREASAAYRRFSERSRVVMANAEVVVVGPGELPLIADLYNEIFRPPHDVEFFRRRLVGRYNPLLLVAQVDKRPIGFSTGFELKPSVFFAWLTGVHADFRRAGIASQLHEAQMSCMECQSAHRAILHMAIQMGVDIVAVRSYPDRTENLIIFEKQISES